MTPEWFVAPATNWHLPPAAIDLLKLSVKSAPFVEIAIAVMLWSPRLRRLAFALTILTHAFALLFLGPLGHNYNWVVWPWNLAMVALVFGLFASGKMFEITATITTDLAAGKISKLPRTPPETAASNLFSLRQTCLELVRARAALAIIAAYGLLPALSYSGRWDSYFSFALYSGNTATADLIITPSLVPRLPEPMRRFAHPLHEDVLAASPGLRGLLVFDMQSWCQAELGVPPIPEPRAYRVIGQAVARHAVEPTDAQLLIKPRRGPVQALRANELR